MRAGLSWACCCLAVVGLACSGQRREATPPNPTQPSATARTERGLPAGSTCRGRTDCPFDQVCVDGVCHYERTSVAGEVLASAARAQLEAGDVSGALGTYDEATAAYTDARAPVPPRVNCGAAAAALRAAGDAQSREVGARLADRCFRRSLPGASARHEVLRALSRLRYDGLDLTLFDGERAADQFFTLEASRPTVDAVRIRIDLPDRDLAGHARAAEVLRGEGSTRAIAECFIEDWELHHDRNGAANLVLNVTTRAGDIGDVFGARVEVHKTSAADEGFEACVAAGLSAQTSDGLRLSRMVAWQEPFGVSAHLQ